MDGTTILISVLGGVTLLLWGCRMIRTGVMRAFGTGLQKFLGEGSTSRWRSVMAGTAVGVALQSSTAMALLVSPFVSHGAIALSVALAIMLGADLGSAIAPWLTNGLTSSAAVSEVLYHVKGTTGRVTLNRPQAGMKTPVIGR